MDVRVQLTIINHSYLIESIREPGSLSCQIVLFWFEGIPGLGTCGSEGGWQKMTAVKMLNNDNYQ